MGWTVRSSHLLSFSQRPRTGMCWSGCVQHYVSIGVLRSVLLVFSPRYFPARTAVLPVKLKVCRVSGRADVGGFYDLARDCCISPGNNVVHGSLCDALRPSVVFRTLLGGPLDRLPGLVLHGTLACSFGVVLRNWWAYTLGSGSRPAHPEIVGGGEWRFFVLSFAIAFFILQCLLWSSTWKCSGC